MQSILEKIAANGEYDDLPSDWKGTDLATFSEGKRLYLYQKQALQRGLLALYRFQQGQILRGYRDAGLTDKMTKNLIEENIKPNLKIYSEYYPTDKDGEIGLQAFLNRMSFWMATGSGKTVVIVKMMELLIDLRRNKQLPKNNILFLTHREDLIEQLRKHIDEFNRAVAFQKGYEIVLNDLRTFPEKENDYQNEMFGSQYVNIFYYRSDLVSNTKKENIINFEDYQNNGKWYLFLDEAHKGGSGDSKMKQYLNIISRNGYLFNFSATFTDDIDRLTTVYNFNLSQFIRAGFGKHLYVFQKEFSIFQRAHQKEAEEYTETEKQKIVLMSLLMLTYVRKKYAILKVQIPQNVYHNPILLALVNSVQTKDSDLILFYRELQKVALKKVDTALLNAAREMLLNEFQENKTYEFEDSDMSKETDFDLLKSITLDDILRGVFNTSHAGVFELRRNPSNKQELLIKVKSGNSQPFGLIKIGDASKLLHEIATEKTEIEEAFDEASVFDNLNESPVTVLMGSRAFYEGWDSNRPNIINFINIGTQGEAQKFILQSIGRGIRIEPVKNKRKRLHYLLQDRIEEAEILRGQQTSVPPLETLFVFGTKRSAIIKVLETLKAEEPTEEHTIALEKSDILFDLLIPTYKQKQAITEKKITRFELHERDALMLKDIVSTLSDSTLILTYNLEFKDLVLLKEKAGGSNFKEHFKTTSLRVIGNHAILIKRVVQYFKIIPEELDDFKILDDEIGHYKQVKVRTTEGFDTAIAINFKRYKDLLEAIERIKNFKPKTEAEIQGIKAAAELMPDPAFKAMILKKLADSTSEEKQLKNP